MAAHDAAADHTLGILYGNAPLAAFDKYDEADHRQHQGDEQDQSEAGERSPLLGGSFGPQVEDAAGQSHDDAGENDQRHSVADATVTDLFTEPHNESGTGGQRQDGHQGEPEPGVIDERRSVGALLALQREGDGKRLKNAQQNGEVARVLGDLAASEFALFLQALEIRPGYRHQLQDDGCGDIGHDAQSKNGEPPEIAAAEQIDNAEH